MYPDSYLTRAYYFKIFQFFYFSISSQNASGATFVTQVQATDKDKSNSQNLFYRIDKGNEVCIWQKITHTDPKLVITEIPY